MNKKEQFIQIIKEKYNKAKDSTVDFFKNKKFKNKNVIIALWVFTLTLVTIGFSYAAFFTVKTNKSNQTVKTGTLSVTYGESSNISSVTKANMIPIPDSEGLAQTDAGVIYIQNEGTMDANYVLTVGYDMENFMNRSDYKDTDPLTPAEYIKIAIYEYNGSEGSTLVVGPITMADLPVYETDPTDSRKTKYALLFDSLGVKENSTKTYQVKTWLNDKAIMSTTDDYFYVKSEIIAEADQTKMAYNFKGLLVDGENNPLSDATVSIQNNSLIATTDATGAFEINSLLPGTYNVIINYNTAKYECNITVNESDRASVTTYGPTFIPTLNMTLAEAANKYGTTVSKLIRKNDITVISSLYKLDASRSYNVPTSFIVNGGLSQDLGTLTFKIADSQISTLTLN